MVGFEKKPPKLFVDGLSPEVSAMEDGCLYAITTEASPSKLPLMIGSIRGNLEEGTACTLIVDSIADVENDQAKALWGASLPSRIADGSLNIFIPQDDFKKNLFRYGIKRFLRELELSSIPSGSFLWIQQAEALFLMQDMPFAVKQAEVLKEWLGARDITAVLVFSRLNKAELNDIHLLQEGLDGLCAVGIGSAGVEAKLAYWRSPSGVAEHENYALALQRNGFYLATRLNTALGPESKADEDQVDEYPKYFCLDPSLKGEFDKTQWPWKYPESHLDLYHATRESKSPTIVFEFSTTTDFVKLAETIHLVRRTVGRNAKIIVHENKFSLRHANETLLMLIGTNLIIHQDFPIWRIAKSIESLQGVRFEREIDGDIDALFANAAASFKSGYLTVSDFIKEAIALVFQADCLSAPKAMIAGVVRPGLNLSDVVRRIEFNREGDLIAAAGGFVYIFLYACPESQVLPTIERKLGESIQSVFSSQQIIFDSSKILEELERIEEVQPSPINANEEDRANSGRPVIDARQLPRNLYAAESEPEQAGGTAIGQDPMAETPANGTAQTSKPAMQPGIQPVVKRLRIDEVQPSPINANEEDRANSGRPVIDARQLPRNLYAAESEPEQAGGTAIGQDPMAETPANGTAQTSKPAMQPGIQSILKRLSQGKAVGEDEGSKSVQQN